MHKKFLFGFFVVFLFVICLINPAIAESFYIDNYDVNIVVDKNKKAHVSEDISVYFTEPKHGIIRNIPINYTVKRANNSSYFESSKISKIKVNDKFSVSSNGTDKFIKIGSPDVFLQGKVNYVISYDYQMHDDKLPDNDEFYFNIIGTQWNTTINNASFSVTLPKEFNPDDIGLSIGTFGTSGYKDRAELSVEGNTIKGYITEPLNNNEGITIRVLLPKGYFNNVINIQIPDEKILGILSVLILTILIYLRWNKYGKNEHTTPIITFYPPKNLNSAEVGRIFSEKNSNNQKDVISLILYLASKGYIKIETKKAGLLNNDFTIKKIKNYDGENLYEKMMMEALFGDDVDVVTKYGLAETTYFYQECEKITDFLKRVHEEYYEDISKKGLFKIFLCWVGVFLFSALSLYGFSVFNEEVLLSVSGEVLEIVLAMLISFSLLPLIILNISGKIFKYCINAILFVFIILIPYLFKVVELSWNTWSYTILAFDVLCFVITSICFANMSKRTTEGNILYQEILGFKQFLQVSEKSRLELLLQENPNYFSEILPYAYVLGISNMLINKFKDLIPQPLTWYEGDFDTKSFNTLIGGIYEVSSPPSNNSSSDSGSSFSSSSGGGGHSGGGGGGGGGSSW